MPEAEHLYGALDLGTNNCRLLVARPTRRGFYVIDAFSRVIRLGEGVAQSRFLSDEAMRRTIEALRICSDKLERRGVRRARLVATEACRIAVNGEAFIERVAEETGLRLEILSREAEARLAVSGCASLIDAGCDWALVFDIGGGSTEIIWLDLSDGVAGGAARERRGPALRHALQDSIAAWTSLPVGVVTLAERYVDRPVTRPVFEEMVGDVLAMLEPFERDHELRRRLAGARFHHLGTSGTVTTVAGVHMGLPRYERQRVDGYWMNVADVARVSSALVDMTHGERIAQPCIGRDRADLVMAGCAILEALLRMWPAERLRVADRGLREGILTTLMSEDGLFNIEQRRRRSRRGGGR